MSRFLLTSPMRNQVLHTSVNTGKRVQLASSTGAGAVGMALGLLLPDWTRLYAIPLLISGVGLHGWGMWQQHRLDRDQKLEAPLWSKVLYWACWLILVGIVVGSALRSR